MQENALPSLPAQANQHFMQALVELSDDHEIEVSEDVYSQNGTKLLARGARVDAKLYERVINHKLRKPIESSLVSSEAFGAEELSAEAERLLDEFLLLRNFCGWSMGQVSPIGILKRLRISPQAGTLLTVANSRNPKSREHLALVVLIAMGLAYATHCRDSQTLMDIAMAGAFHDIGEIYVDPKFFASPSEITPLQWQSFSAHPIIGAALVREVVGLGPACQTAILQHHERNDGMGYPLGICGKTMTSAANLLALAEMGAAMRGRSCPLHRIDIALKIVPSEFDSEIVRLIHTFLGDQWGLFKESYDASRKTVDVALEISGRIEKAWELRHEWDTTHPFTSKVQVAIDSLFERFVRVNRAFASTGMDGLDRVMPGLGGMDLNEICMESNCVLEEILWRLTRLSRDLALKSLSFSEAENREALRLAYILAGQADHPDLEQEAPENEPQCA